MQLASVSSLENELIVDNYYYADNLNGKKLRSVLPAENPRQISHIAGFLPKDICKLWIDFANQRRSYWNVASFFSNQIFILGKPSHLVKKFPLRSRFNYLMIRAELIELISTLNTSLCAELGVEDVKILRRSCPGFHIFTGSSLKGGGVLHIDTSHFTFHKNYESVRLNENDIFNFTLSLNGDDLSTGLDIWDTSLKDLKDESSLFDLSKYQRKSINYSTGDLLIHSGLKYHRIMPIQDSSDHIYHRYSIQFHGHVLDNILYIYW